MAESQIRRATATLRDIEREKPLVTGYERFTLLLFARAIKAARASLVLAKAGYDEDSRSVLRTIYELLQHAAFVNIEPRTAARKVQVFIEIERIEEKHADAELLCRHRALNTPMLRRRRSEIRRRRRKHTTGPDFEDASVRFAWLRSGERRTTLLAFLRKLEGDTVSQGSEDLLDHFLRRIGNRYVHSGPAALEGVFGTRVDKLGRTRLKMKPVASRRGVREAYGLITIMVSQFSFVMAKLFFPDGHRVVERVRGNIQALERSTRSKS